MLNLWHNSKQFFTLSKSDSGKQSKTKRKGYLHIYYMVPNGVNGDTGVGHAKFLKLMKYNY